MTRLCSLLHHHVTHCWIIALNILVLLSNLSLGTLTDLQKSKEKEPRQQACVKRQEKRKRKATGLMRTTFQSLHQSQWISDVSHAMKDSDEKQSQSAQMIDARGWPVRVASYWCINYIQESCPNMSRTICRLSSQREQAGLRLIIGLSDLSQVFQWRRITYATLEDVTVAATVLRMEGNSRQGIELLNVSHQQQNVCLEVPYLILKENKNICLIQ